MDETLTPVQKFLVSETEKIHAIPKFLQPYFIEIEARTQDFLRRFSTDYTGGNWNGPDRNLNTLYYDVLRYAVSQTPYKTKIACAID